MDEPRLLRRIKLTSAHKPTGKTRHLHGDEPLPPPNELRIVQYSSDPGYYLFYCDESGIEMTDTYHDSVKEAMDQAEFEFGITADEWNEAESS
jgi:hypothetical protein